MSRARLKAAARPAAKRRHWSPASQAFYRQRRAEERALERRIQDDTCGLGNWQRPEGWDRTPFSHTVTTVDGVNAGFDSGWQIYNSGVVVALVVHDHDTESYTRGLPYVWCKPTRNGNGTGGGPFPTACIFGRFIEKDRQGRPVALVGKGKRQAIEAGHSMCFRAVGHVYQGEEFFPRSETPVPIPSEAVRQTQPMHFDVLQHHLGKLDQVLCAMSGITDMTDELTDAEKAAGKDDPQAKAWRQSRAYEALEPILTDAMRRSALAREGMDTFLKASPELAYWLKRWQDRSTGDAT